MESYYYNGGFGKISWFAEFLIFYKVNDKREVIAFRIKQLTPTKDVKEVYLKPEAWVQAMELLQDRHNLICRKKDVA